jgi:hypothetical protein
MKNILFISLTALMPLCGFAAGAVTKGLSKLLPQVEVLFRPGCEIPVRMASRTYVYPLAQGSLTCLIADRLMDEVPGHINPAEMAVSQVKEISMFERDEAFHLQRLRSVYEEVAPTDWLAEGKNGFDIGIMLALFRNYKFMLCASNSCNFYRSGEKFPYASYGLPMSSELRRDVYRFPAIIKGGFSYNNEFVLEQLLEISDDSGAEHLRILYSRGEVEKVKKLITLGLADTDNDMAILIHPEGAWQRVDESPFESRGEPPFGS